jgi:hypothetical protein
MPTNPQVSKAKNGRVALKRCKRSERVARPANGTESKTRGRDGGIELVAV